MSDFQKRILQIISERHGLTDREITDLIKGRGEGQQHVNQECNRLARLGQILRTTRSDGRIGNYPNVDFMQPGQAKDRNVDSAPIGLSNKRGDLDQHGMSEDQVKESLKNWLEQQHWIVKIAFGHSRGTDILATNDHLQWRIEAKGSGSRPPMFNNYFLGVLGEILQRMDSEVCKYSIAFPNDDKFQRLWKELPRIAKSRTRLTALFVDSDGSVVETE